MRRRISGPEVTLILSGTDRPRVSVGKPGSLSRLTFSSFHSFTRVVKQTEPGGTNSCSRFGVSIGKGVIRKRALSMSTATRAASTSSERRSEEHTSELQSLMRISYAVFCLKKKKKIQVQPHSS